MAKNIKLTAIEKDYGPVLPGIGTADRTISVFHEHTSKNRYQLYGTVGLIEGAIWHLHTQLPIDHSKVTGQITGIVQEGPQNDPYRKELAAKWLGEYEAKEVKIIKDFEAKQKAAADKKEIAQRKKEEAAQNKEQAKREAARRKNEEAVQKRRAAEAKKEEGRKFEGEYPAELVVGGSLNIRLNIKIKVDNKGKITLANKSLTLPVME